jgi:hypothetical protein
VNGGVARTGSYGAGIVNVGYGGGIVNTGYGDGVVFQGIVYQGIVATTTTQALTQILRNERKVVSV